MNINLLVTDLLPFYIHICRKTLRCLHHRLRKISLQDLKRRIAVQTAVRLHLIDLYYSYKHPY